MLNKREEITYQQATIYYFVYRINTTGFRFTDMNLLMNFEKRPLDQEGPTLCHSFRHNKRLLHADPCCRSFIKEFAHAFSYQLLLRTFRALQTSRVHQPTRQNHVKGE